MKKLFVLLLSAVLMVMALPAMAQDAPGTIADIVVASASAETPEFSTLLAAVQAGDPAVLEALSNPEAALTVFAPTDAAFAALAEALGAEAFGAVLADPAALTNILLFHVLDGKVMSADVVAGLEANDGMLQVPSLQGQYIDIAQTDDGITVNGANLNLDMVDIEASNGVIHVIDAVILPESRTIAEIAVEMAGDMEAPQFTALLAAVQAADPAILELLSNPDAALTVFAPVDEAFAALGEDTLKSVLADSATVTSILQYHVIPAGEDGAVVGSDDLGTLLADAPAEGLDVPTALEGASLNFSVVDGAAVINGSTGIVITNVDAANGIIHVIDAVLLPPQ
jgi:transforming growth factor-beta-induced protein